jgi:hypothetical protein
MATASRETMLYKKLKKLPRVRDDALAKSAIRNP